MSARRTKELYVSEKSLIRLLIKEYATVIVSPAVSLLDTAINTLRSVAPDTVNDRELTAMFLHEALGAPFAVARLRAGVDGTVVVRGNLLLTADGTTGFFAGNEFVIGDVRGADVAEVSVNDFFVD